MGTVQNVVAVMTNELYHAAIQKADNKQYETISQVQAIRLINQSKGHFFGIEYKKVDSTYRKMTCRLGVTTHLAGGQKAYEDIPRDMLTVWIPTTSRRQTTSKKPDRGYRTIYIYNILSLTIKGKKYLVK